AFVEREFLPMGNPETRFAYGIVRRGRALRLRLDPRLLAASDVYFTLYSRDSFPACWYQVFEADHTTPAAVEDGFFLLRLHRRAATDAPDPEGLIDIRPAQ